MPVFDVTAPDGKVFEVNVPEGASEKDAIAYLASTYTPEIPVEGEGSALADVPIGFARGAVQGVRFIADAFGADNPVSEALKGAESYLGRLMSAQSKKDAEEISRIMEEAEDKGALDQVLAGLQALTVAPVDLITQAFGTAAPMLVGGLFGMGARTVRALGAMSGAGITKSAIYDATKNELIKAGVPEKDAEARALAAQEYGGENLDQILLGGAFGLASSVTGIEKALIPSLARNIVDKAAKKSVFVNAGKVALGEAIPEGAQAAQEQVAQNIALQRQGFEVPTFQGAVGAATLEGLVGGLLGGGIGAIAPERAAPPTPPAPPPVAPATPAVTLPEAPPPMVGAPAPEVAVPIPGVQAPPTGIGAGDFLSPAEVRLQKQQQAAQLYPGLTAPGQVQPAAEAAPDLMAGLEQERLAKQTQAGMTMEGLVPPRAPTPAPMEMAPVTPSQVPAREPVAITPQQRQERIFKVDQLYKQLAEATTEADRANIRAQIDVTLGVREAAPQARFADLNPMDLRTATGRLGVLKSQQPEADLNVVPHPSIPNAFAIESRPAPAPEAAPAPSFEAQRAERLGAQQRIEAAEMAGRPQDTEEQARQVILSRALQNIEERGGVASPEEAQIIQEANVGIPYDRIDYGLSPQGTVDQRLTEATGIALQPTPREAVTEPSRMAEGQRQAMQAETERRAQAAPEVDAVLDALYTPEFNRTADEVSTVRIARQRYAPEDFRLMEQAALDPESLTPEGTQRLNNIRQFGPRFSLTDEVNTDLQLADEVRKKLLPVLKRFGLGDVALKLIDSLEGGRANGAYFKQVITIALDSDNPLGVMRHEVIHALKELGAFTPAEWRVLTKRAREEWMGRFIGDNMVELYRQQYLQDNNGDITGFQEYIEEEAIAEAFKFFESNKPPAGMIQNLLRRLKNMFNAIKDFFSSRNLTSEDIFLSEQIFRDIEGGRMTRRGAMEERAPAFDLRSPLEEYVSPEEAEGRIRRREAREPGTGAPTNPRNVFKNKDVDFPVGKITKEDWLNRVQSLMPEEEIKDSRVWYQQLNDALTPLFGDQAPEYALAWLLSQKRASPTKGLLDVLRASDVAKGKKRLIGAGLNEQALIDVLSGRMPEGGVGAKLLDFVDSELGLPTRTVVRGDPRGRQPAAIDVWAQRDIGFVDNTVFEFIKKKFGEKAAEKVQIDKTTGGESQYEYGIDFYNDVVDMLNAQNYMGGGWTAREVQAVGWVTMQRAMGIQAEFVRDIIGGNTRRISIGLAPGEGSVMAGKLMGKEIPPTAAKRVVTELAELANVRVRKNIAGVGAYLTYTEGSIQVDALASPEAVADLMDMIGYVFQQTEVINTRPLKSGKNMAIDIISPKLKSVDDATKFFAEFLNLVPKDKDGDPIAPGFQQIEIDGQPGIRLLNFAGKWRAKQVEDINQAIKQASQNAKIDVNDVVVNNVDMRTTKNDWSKEHDGISYLDSLRNRGRLQEAELLQRRYPPSRFDLEGDGTIGWGGPRYSLRPDQLAFRPSDSGREGIAFNDRQPDAKSFAGSHYGNARLESLSAAKYGSGLKGAEARRLDQSFDDRIRKRMYFYIPQTNGEMPVRESGVGNFVYSQKFDNILAPGETMSRLYKQANGDSNNFESAVIDAGYDGYAVPDYGMMVILNNDVPVQYEGTASEVITKQQDPANAPRYSLRTKPAPKKTVTAYKLFRVDENRPGELFPLFIDANTPVPIGQWMDADMGEGYAFQAENGHFYIPSTEYETVNERTGKREKRKTGVGIKIPNEQVRQELIDRGFLPKGSKATQIVALARRPGWHAGDLPMSTHLGYKSPGSQVVDTRSANQVWAEVEMPADVDWQSEAKKRGVNKAGKFIAKNADITDEMPADGFYKYKTSPTMTGSWMIGGSLKVNRILSDTEVAAINEKAGVKDLPRAKPFEAEKYGLGSKRYSLRPEAKQVVNTEPFKRWFRKSKIVNADGTPKIMYHGTARDITEFRPKQAGAIFVTESPRFAESFTEMSEDYMVKELFNSLTPEERNQLIMKAANQAVKDGNITKKQLGEIKREFSGMDVTYGFIPASIEIEVSDLLRDRLPSRSNIVPLYVRAERPFDYANPAHLDEIARNDAVSEGALFHVSRGAWSAIEDPDVQEAIREAGFDGFYVLEAGQKNLAVYNPNQLKSATGNIGTFDETGRIRYNLVERAPNAPPQILTKTTEDISAGKAVQKATTDALNAIRDNQYMTGKRTEWFDVDAGLAKRLQNLPIFQADGTLRADMLKHSQRQVINIVNLGLSSGQPYITSDGSVAIRRTEDNLARSVILADQLSIHPAVVASGLTGKNFIAELARTLRGADILAEDARLRELGVQQLEQAKQLYKQVKAAGKAGNMKLAKQLLRKIAQLRKEGYANKKMNRELQVTPEQIAWAKKQLNDVPQAQEILDIWKSVNTSLVNLYEESGILSPEKAQEYRDNKFYVPLFKSREDLDVDMFDLAVGEKKPPSRGIGVGAKTPPGKEKKLKGADIERNIWENLQTQYAKMVASAYENQTRRIAFNQLVGLDGARVANPAEKHNLVFRDKGKDVKVVVENPNVMAAFQTFSTELGPIMKFFGGVTQVLRAGALINPMFWLRQLIRDPIHASLVANTGFISPATAAKNFMRESASVLGLAESSESARILAERGVIGPIDTTIDLKDFLKGVGKEKMKDPNFMQRALHKLLQIHEASDAATRVAIFDKAKAKALKDGLSEEAAINLAVYKARESINFSVKGMHPFLGYARQLIPFLNATIVGLDTLYKAATGYALNPEERRQAMKQFYKYGLMMFFMSSVYAMAYQDDDDYKKQPDYVKDNNFLIPIGTGENSSFIKIPIPYEVGFIFKTLPEVAIRYAYGTSTGKEMYASYKAGLLHNLPTGGVPIPQVARPAYEVITNYSFFTGRPIESLGEQGFLTGYRGRKASEFAKMMSNIGLDKLDLSPVEIDYLMQGYFAELGTLGTQLSSAVIAYGQGKEPPAMNLEEMPFFKSFMTNPNSDKAVADFYEITNTAQQTARTFNDMAKVGKGEQAQAMLQDPETMGMIGASSSMRKIRDSMAKIRQAMRIVQEAPDMSPEEKRSQMNELNRVFNSLAQQGVELADQLGIR